MRVRPPDVVRTAFVIICGQVHQALQVGFVCTGQEVEVPPALKDRPDISHLVGDDAPVGFPRGEELRLVFRLALPVEQHALEVVELAEPFLYVLFLRPYVVSRLVGCQVYVAVDENAVEGYYVAPLHRPRREFGRRQHTRDRGELRVVFHPAGNVVLVHAPRYLLEFRVIPVLPAVPVAHRNIDGVPVPPSGYVLRLHGVERAVILVDILVDGLQCRKISLRAVAHRYGEGGVVYLPSGLVVRASGRTPAFAACVIEHYLRADEHLVAVEARFPVRGSRVPPDYVAHLPVLVYHLVPVPRYGHIPQRIVHRVLIHVRAEQVDAERVLHNPVKRLVLSLRRIGQGVVRRIELPWELADDVVYASVDKFDGRAVIGEVKYGRIVRLYQRALDCKFLVLQGINRPVLVTFVVQEPVRETVLLLPSTVVVDRHLEVSGRIHRKGPRCESVKFGHGHPVPLIQGTLGGELPLPPEYVIAVRFS